SKVHNELSDIREKNNFTDIFYAATRCFTNELESEKIRNNDQD
ncbi:11844_t:CDS:1, partial [Scutellospora calospora]